MAFARSAAQAKGLWISLASPDHRQTAPSERSDAFCARAHAPRYLRRSSRRRSYDKARSRRPPSALGSFNPHFNAPATVAHNRGRQSSYVRKQSPVRKRPGTLR
ncbi:hypothetical protein CBM2613_B10361 [Cupriavidus taiwanensis]|uniref:Uncharacterized protein n=1 Tax=Cupriavidus taiwanensis TaxID=164546 RepID=A0A375E6F9_9BURK|nr:hypothetical protein CBM2613_B10361 [Cupriavidus taiwanensis]